MDGGMIGGPCGATGEMATTGVRVAVRAGTGGRTGAVGITITGGLWGMIGDICAVGGRTVVWTVGSLVD